MFFFLSFQQDSLMYGISMMRERSASHKMGSLVDESSYVRKENCYFSHSFENHNDNFYPRDEDMFCKPQVPKGWQCKFCCAMLLPSMATQMLWPKKILHSIFLLWTANCSRRYDGLPDVNSDKLWNIESFNSDDHFPTPRVEHFDTVDYGFKERYSPDRRLFLHLYQDTTNNF